MELPPHSTTRNVEQPFLEARGQDRFRLQVRERAPFPSGRYRLPLYGSICQSSNSHHEAHHNISTVSERLADRVVWILPEDITSDGCLSAWLPYPGLVGRSEPLKVNKFSKQWMKKRDMDQGTRLSRRASIPMSKASGIDAQ